MPVGTEACNILIAETDFLENPIAAFVRLKTSSKLRDITEIPVPTRFIFVLLGKSGEMEKYHEVGRAMGTLITDEVNKDISTSFFR